MSSLFVEPQQITDLNTDDSNLELLNVCHWKIKTKNEGLLSEEDRVELFIQLSESLESNAQIPLNCFNSRIELSSGDADLGIMLGFNSVLGLWSEIQEYLHDEPSEEVNILRCFQNKFLFMNGSSYHWEPMKESGIDKTLLQDRKQDILYYSEIPFFNDLNGDQECSFSAKFRVMPTCWFLKITFWRKTKFGIRIIEIRLFQKSNQVNDKEEDLYREVQERGIRWDQLTTFDNQFPVNLQTLNPDDKKYPILPLLSENHYSKSSPLFDQEEITEVKKNEKKECCSNVKEEELGPQIEHENLIPIDDDLCIKIREQCEYYFSDENLPNDEFMLDQLVHDDMISLDVLMTFNKIKKMIKKLNKITHGSMKLSDILRTSSILKLNSQGTRVGRVLPLPIPLTDIALRVLKLRNVSLNDDDAIQKLFLSKGFKAEHIISIKFISGTLQSGSPSIDVEMCSLYLAIKACEIMNDTSNWRNGLRVEFKNGMSCINAKKQLQKLMKNNKKMKQEVQKEEIISEEKKEISQSAICEEDATKSQTRQRGNMLKVNRGNYGFIVPLNPPANHRREDNAFFQTSGMSLVPDHGDILEYDLFFVNGKPNAKNIVIVEKATSVLNKEERRPLDDHKQRPEVFKSNLQPVHVKMAKGPDRTLGFIEGYRSHKT